MSEASNAANLSSLKVPLLVDLGVIASVIFGGGIVWNKVDALAIQVSELRSSVAVSTPQAQDRLARIEERLIAMQGQIVELKQQVKEGQH